MSDQTERRPPPVLMEGCRTGGCGGGAAAKPRPEFPSFGAVRVDGVEIDPAEIAREITHHPAETPEAAWKAAARALVVRELLLREARRRGLAPEPERDAAGRSETEEDALVRRLLEASLAPETPDEAACRRVYEASRDRFRTPDLFEASHILIAPKDQDEEAWRAAGLKARAIIESVGDDQAAFAEAAREFSACATSRQNGSLGQVRRGELEPPVQEAIEATAEGATWRRPVRSRRGWHVVRLHRRLPGRPAPFEAVQGAIADMLEARSWSLAAGRLVAGLAETAEIEGIALEAPEGVLAA